MTTYLRVYIYIYDYTTLYVIMDIYIYIYVYIYTYTLYYRYTLKMLGWQSLRNRLAARLPRFRLFGDTMNTAARMMQKGLPGEVGEINIPRFFWQNAQGNP